MTDLILIMSRCLKKMKKVNEQKDYYRFHFKGYYLGEKVSEIIVRPTADFVGETDEEYLLWVRRRSLNNGVLKVDLIKGKKIS